MDERLPLPDRRTNFLREIVAADLECNVISEVVTRFPPEPNGHLHIGHAKSLAVNFDIAREFGGRCLLRFDDTNPLTERREYVDSIVADVRWLGYEPDAVTFASDRFETLYQWAEVLVTTGQAYVDDQPADVISAQRGRLGSPGIDSPYRARSAEENLALFRAMRDGSFPDGSRVLRAKIDMAATDPILRDPVLYRVRRAEHPRTGTDWVIYPTYDWAHGQVDALEGITHSIATLEFGSHRALYDWLLDRVPIPGARPRQFEFARLEIDGFVTSKRALRELVDTGQAAGWDDPRLPTLKGMRRRGYQPEIVRSFLAEVGVARTNSAVSAELLTHHVRRHHNAHARRKMVVLDPVRLVLTDWPVGAVAAARVANNPERPEDGERTVEFRGEAWVERDDVAVDPPGGFTRLSVGREVRLRSLVVVTVEDVITDAAGAVIEVRCTHDPNSHGGAAAPGSRVKATLHWVPIESAVRVGALLYDAPPAPVDSHPVAIEQVTVRMALAEESVGDVQPGEVVQFDRLGYFAADIDGSFHRTVALRDDWARHARHFQSPTAKPGSAPPRSAGGGACGRAAGV